MIFDEHVMKNQIAKFDEHLVNMKTVKIHWVFMCFPVHRREEAFVGKMTSSKGMFYLLRNCGAAILYIISVLRTETYRGFGTELSFSGYLIAVSLHPHPLHPPTHKFQHFFLVFFRTRRMHRPFGDLQRGLHWTIKVSRGWFRNSRVHLPNDDDQ